MSAIKTASKDGANGGRTQISGPRVTQEFDDLQANPVGLDAKVARTSVENLNQVLADTIMLRDLYKKHHWQAAGPTFYMIHLLFDKHFEEQNKLADMVAEHIQTLGGIAIALGGDVAEASRIPRAPRDRESTQTQIERLVEGHRIILKECRAFAKAAEEDGDDGTNDLLVSNVIRTNELQAWFVDQQLK